MISSKKTKFIYENVICDDDLHIVLDFDESFGTGVVRAYDNTIDLAIVGANKLLNQPVISDNDFMTGLVAIYHEDRHVNQIHEANHKNDEYVNVLKYSYYAGHMDSSYVDVNYFISPREIEAELYGMYHAYCYCVDVFGKEMSDKLLCNYANNRMQKGISFVHRNSKNYRYNNVDDIFTDMSKAYADSVYAQREITQPIKDFLHNSPYMLQRLEHEKIGYKQDRMIASLYLGQTRNKYLHYLPGLSKIDWSHETNFGTNESVVDKVKEHMSIRKRRGEMADEIMQRIHDNSSENRQIDGIDY